jgi:hypothetical protein
MAARAGTKVKIAALLHYQFRQPAGCRPRTRHGWGTRQSRQTWDRDPLAALLFALLGEKSAKCFEHYCAGWGVPLDAREGPPAFPANLGRMKMPNAIGEGPTSIVATTVLVAVAMTDTAWSNWFAT